MLIVMFVIFLILFVLFLVFWNDYDLELLGAFLALCLIVTLIAIIAVTTIVIKNKKIDQVITMYQDENAAIENRMDDLVKGYMTYESETLEKFSPESSITLVSLYPELKSDELVKQQIDIYMANNQKIKELKEESIYASTRRWWLYFGN